MSNKLQNTKAIQEMMSGTHKSQTRKSYGFNKTVTEKHAVGDVWTETDAKGTVWRIEQKDVIVHDKWKIVYLIKYVKH